MLYNFILVEDACKNGDMELALLMIESALKASEKGVQANQKIMWNEGLYMACLGGHKKLVMLMIENGANDWNWGLHSACQYNHREIVDLMISYGARSERELDWNEGLIGACIGGHKDLAELMIKLGRDLDWNRGLAGACYGCHMELVLLMIKMGANDWNMGVTNAFSSMSNPNKKGYAEIMNLMIEKGANVWKTCLMYACEICDRKLVESMITRMTFGTGGVINIKDANMALRYSCEGGHKEMVELMISYGANDWNWSLLTVCRKGHNELVTLMIEKGANNFNEGMSCACYGGHKDIVLLMISYGANGWNQGLYNACEGGHKELALLMIEHGANNWNMGLQTACQGRHIELALLMIEKGESISNCDMYLRNNHIYYLVQKGVSEFEEYNGVANTFRESQLLLSVMLKLVLNNDLVSEILLY